MLLPSPTALGGSLERTSTHFFFFFFGECRVTSTFSVRSLLELGANFSSGNCMVFLDLHSCDLQEKGEIRPRVERKKSAFINTPCANI